jgi:hypothetical protein
MLIENRELAYEIKERYSHLCEWQNYKIMIGGRCCGKTIMRSVFIMQCAWTEMFLRRLEIEDKSLSMSDFEQGLLEIEALVWKNFQK